MGSYPVFFSFTPDNTFTLDLAKKAWSEREINFGTELYQEFNSKGYWDTIDKMPIEYVFSEFSTLRIIKFTDYVDYLAPDNLDSIFEAVLNDFSELLKAYAKDFPEQYKDFEFTKDNILREWLQDFVDKSELTKYTVSNLTKAQKLLLTISYGVDYLKDEKLKDKCKDLLDKLDGFNYPFYNLLDELPFDVTDDTYLFVHGV